MAASILWAHGIFAFFLQKTSRPIKFLVLGEGIGFVLGEGGVPILFYGRGDFSDCKKVVFKKGWFRPEVPERKPERGYIRMFPRRNENRKGVRSHVPPERKPEQGHIRQNHPKLRNRPLVSQ